MRGIRNGRGGGGLFKYDVGISYIFSGLLNRSMLICLVNQCRTVLWAHQVAEISKRQLTDNKCGASLGVIVIGCYSPLLDEFNRSSQIMVYWMAG